MKKFKKFKHSLYYQASRSILLGIGSALINVGLSYLPYADILQAIWIFISTTYIALISLKRRVNEDDDNRFKRLYEERVRLWSRRDPEVLNALFSQNLAHKQIEWLSEDLDVPLHEIEGIHALDSLTCAGDQPGRIAIRAGLLLGRWCAEIDLESDSKALDQSQINRLEAYQNRLNSWVEEHLSLLGEEINPGVFVRELKQGEQRPIGIHICSSKSELLFTYENTHYQQDGANEENSPRLYSVSLSANQALTQSLTDEEWDQWRNAIFKAFPFFKRLNQGSGPQKKLVPYFIQPRLLVDQFNLDETKNKLAELHELLTQLNEE